MTNEQYEELAALFEKETGLLAPGKDWPAAAHCPISDEELRQRWRNWLRDRAT